LATSARDTKRKRLILAQRQSTCHSATIKNGDHKNLAKRDHLFATDAGIRREPELRAPEEIAPAPAKPTTEFTFAEENSDDEIARASILRRQARSLARQAAMDPNDGLGL
jgi:hypothetical protein